LGVNFSLAYQKNLSKARRAYQIKILE